MLAAEIITSVSNSLLENATDRLSRTLVDGSSIKNPSCHGTLQSADKLGLGVLLRGFIHDGGTGLKEYAG